MKSTQQRMFTETLPGSGRAHRRHPKSKLVTASASATPMSACVGRRALAALLLVLPGTSACSKDAVLEAVRQRAESHYDTRRQERLRECELRLSEPERERCRRELPPASFEEYERLRRTVPR